MKLVALILLHLFLLSEAVIFTGTGVDNNTVDGKPIIHLGGLFPVHRNEDNACGEILDLGMQRLEAMVFAIQLINQSPYLLPEVILGFEIRDTCVLPNFALEESLDLVTLRSDDNGISGVVGAASSSITIVVANLLRLFQLPQISYASTAKILSDKTRFDYFFRTVPPDSLQTQAMADIIKHFNWTFIHAIYSDDAYGSEGIGAFFEEINKINSSRICIATSSKIPPGVLKESVFDAVVQKLSQAWKANSSVVVLFGQLSTATGVLNAVKKMDQEQPGFAERFTWIGSDAWGDQLPKEFHKVAKGMLSVSPKASHSYAFDRYFQSLNPLNYTDNPWFEEYWRFLFNCSFETDDTDFLCNPTKQAISPAIGYRQNSKVTFTIDAVYAFAHAIDDLISIECPDDNLCPEIIDSRSGGTAIKGELLLKRLQNVSFPGMSAAEISFDSSGDEKSDFVIKNLKRSSGNREEYLYDTVGTWSPITFLELSNDIVWNTGNDSVPLSVCSLPCRGGEFPELIPDQSECCWHCKPCLGEKLVSKGKACSVCDTGYKPNAEKTECVLIPPNYLHWNSPWSIITMILTLFGLIATGCVIAVFLVFRKYPMVKASSRELSGLMLCGLLLCYIMPLSFIIKPSVTICSIRRLGIGLAFSICYSALLVKTNRIYRIFSRANSSLQKPSLISPRSQLLITFILISVQVIITVIWLAVEKPNVVVFYDNLIVELQCKGSSIVGFFIYVGYNFLLLILTSYYGYKSRKIPQAFNETKLINVTLFASCLLWVVLAPAYFASGIIAGTIYQIISLIFGTLLSATTVLIVLFMPKVYLLFSERRKVIREEASRSNLEMNRINFSTTNAMTNAMTDNSRVRPQTMDLLGECTIFLVVYELYSDTVIKLVA